MARAFRRPALGIALLVLSLIPAPALAQFSDTYNFLKAVKDRNGEDLTKLLSKPDFQGIDTHDPGNGETALHIVTKRRDLEWLRFLLYKGAHADMRDGSGGTPLLDAATIGWAEGEQQLLQIGANPNIANQNGETPLMRAAAANDSDSVRLLLEAGANPATRDRMTGKTARDYAAQTGRGSSIVRMLDDAKPAKPMMGPHL